MSLPGPHASSVQQEHQASQQELQQQLGQGMALESLCMRCREQGTTRLLLTTIPHFREIVVMAFECPHCGESNNEVQFAGSLQPLGCKNTLTVSAGDAAALDRQIVKSDTARICIPELEFEVPPEAQKGSLSTVEGVLTRAAEELGALQDERRKANPDTAAKIDSFLSKLKDCSSGKAPFTFVLDDPAGNSFIQNLCAPAPDPQLTVEHYGRTPEENARLGFLADPSQEADPAVSTNSSAERAHGHGDAAGKGKAYVPAGTARRPHGSVGSPIVNQAIASQCTPQQAESLLVYAGPEEVMAFPAHCSACSAPSETRMYVTNIPYFKEVIIMSTACDGCGFRSSELKAGGSISDQGKRICLLVKSASDLTRDVIKSDTAAVAIPELELELSAGTLGGRVTTVEGLVSDIQENLAKVLPFQMGDSAPVWQRGKWQAVQSKLKGLLEVKDTWHLILDDALANSFIAPSVGNSMQDDPQLAVEEYKRSWDQDEELGLHDMNTQEQEAP